jgi:hypothetical protein
MDPGRIPISVTAIASMRSEPQTARGFPRGGQASPQPTAAAARLRITGLRPYGDQIDIDAYVRAARILLDRPPAE